MRLDGQDVGIDGQRVAVANGVGHFARPDVDALRSQPKDGGCARRRRVAEVEADRRAHLFHGPRWLHVQLHHQVAARFERPRQIRGHEGSHLPGGPAEEVTVGILGRARHEAVIAGQRIGGVEPPRRGGAIDPDVGVVHDAGITRMELDAPHVAAFLDRHGQGENPEGVRGVGPEDEGLGQGDDKVGCAEQPAVSERGRPGGCRWIALGRPRGSPGLEAIELLGGDRSLVGKVTDGRVDLPGGHEPRAGYLHDLPRPLAHLPIRSQAEGAGSSGTMAGRTGLEDDRGDVWPGRRRCGAPGGFLRVRRDRCQARGGLRQEGTGG